MYLLTFMTSFAEYSNVMIRFETKKSIFDVLKFIVICKCFLWSFEIVIWFRLYFEYVALYSNEINELIWYYIATNFCCKKSFKSRLNDCIFVFIKSIETINAFIFFFSFVTRCFTIACCEIIKKICFCRNWNHEFECEFNEIDWSNTFLENWMNVTSIECDRCWKLNTTYWITKNEKN